MRLRLIMKHSYLLAALFCVLLAACSKNIPGDNARTRTTSDTISNDDGITITVDDEWNGTITVEY